jgi:hypothetical protein
MDSSKPVVSAGSKTIEKPSSEDLALATVIGKYLDLTASLWPVTLNAAAVSFWKEELAKFSAEKIERAFREYLGDATNETYPPKPGDIKELIYGYLRDEAPTLVEKVRAQLK